MSNAVRELSHNDAHAPDRRMIVAYLKYAAKDVAALNETSGRLLQLAIAYLEGRASDAQTPGSQ
jgi:hypothetical protein